MNERYFLTHRNIVPQKIGADGLKVMGESQKYHANQETWLSEETLKMLQTKQRAFRKSKRSHLKEIEIATKSQEK